MSRTILFRLLGLLGIAVITAPFLWFVLKPDPRDSTLTTVWSPAHGLLFFTDLLPVFLAGFLLWLGIRVNRRWGWGAALERSPAWQETARFSSHYGAWIAAPIVLCGPLVLSPSSVGLLTDAGIYMLLALGLNITVGMTGLLVLGYAGFIAFGAYFFAVGQQYLGFFPWWLAAPLAFPLGGLAGYLLGLPCLRLRGDYLAIVTLGFAEAFRETLGNLDFTGGAMGISLKNASMFRGQVGFAHAPQFAYVVVAAVLFLAVFLVQRLYHSPVGRAWIAIRENEIAASAMGIPVVRMKLLAFSLSAAIAALAGVLFAAKVGLVIPGDYDFQKSITVLAMVIIGGLGNSYGALLGAALIYLVPAYLQLVPITIHENPLLNAIVPPALSNALQHLSDYRLLLFGAIMVIMMLYRPQGLLGSARRKEEILHR
jgi:branched-chain amino acid transport system permease protein